MSGLPGKKVDLKFRMTIQDNQHSHSNRRPASSGGTKNGRLAWHHGVNNTATHRSPRHAETHHSMGLLKNDGKTLTPLLNSLDLCGHRRESSDIGSNQTTISETSEYDRQPGGYWWTKGSEVDPDWLEKQSAKSGIRKDVNSASREANDKTFSSASGVDGKDAIHSVRRQNGELPDKIYITRRSVLTELFEISHIQTIYHIFVAILIVFILNTFLHDLVEKGTINFNFEMITWAFGKCPKVLSTWVLMQLSTLLVVYPAFYFWVSHRTPKNARIYDCLWLGFVVVYQLAFLFIPMMYIFDHDLPPASSVIIATEQTRFIMKTYAFIRENTARVLSKKKDDNKKDEENDCPDFSKYLYFLFAPTLVYRDNYPRTQTISWRYVVTNFAQVLACLFYTYFIFERFCVPVFQNFNRDHITPSAFFLSAFGCMMPATLVLFIGFFAILHSWLNAFAEMLRFGDRLFYKDWWNSTTFSNYYRTWNVVVHDWLYTYIYKDVWKVCRGNRPAAMACVFLISAVFHEYILTCTFKFFYPVLFVMFTGAGFGFIFLTDKGSSRNWNVFMWVALFLGNGMLMCLYSMEFYARENCKANTENFLDYLIPRSWNCETITS